MPAFRKEAEKPLIIQVIKGFRGKDPIPKARKDGGFDHGCGRPDGPVPINRPVHKIFGKKDSLYAGNTPGINIYTPLLVGTEAAIDKIHILSAIRYAAIPRVPVQVVQFVRIEDPGEEFPVKMKLRIP
jgi:hypothetical protein